MEEKERLIKVGKIKRDTKEKTGDKFPYQKVPYAVPEGWVWCRLGEICDYGTCKSVNPKEIAYNTWILDLEDIEKDTAKLLQRTRKIERNTTSIRHSFSKGNVLYSKLRTYLNKVLVADKQALLGSNLPGINLTCTNCRTKDCLRDSPFSIIW